MTDRISAEQKPAFHEHEQRLARQRVLLGSGLLLFAVPFFHWFDMVYLSADMGARLDNGLVRGLVFVVALVLLSLASLSSPRPWLRYLPLVLGTVLVGYPLMLLALNPGVADEIHLRLSQALVLLMVTVALLAIRGWRDLIPIYLIPVCGFLLYHWHQGTLVLGKEVIMPVLAGLIAVVVAQTLYRAQVQSFLTTESLRQNAITDALTGLLNRRGMIPLLDAARAEAGREHRPCAVIMADLDRFKRVNDTYGHDVGDEVLAELSNRLNWGVRTEDAVSRWGGEEFLILLQGPSANHALEVAEKIRHLVINTPFQTSAGSLDISISLGVAAIKTGESVETWIQRADQALFDAKNAGRNRSILA